jgi:cytoskeletal protein RodZ
MSGKRAKPSPWRFLRVAPVVVIAVIVWVMVGFFLLFPGSGSDEAHDPGTDPGPSSSADEPAVRELSPSAAEPSPSSSPSGTPTPTVRRTADPSPAGRSPAQPKPAPAPSLEAALAAPKPKQVAPTRPPTTPSRPERPGPGAHDNPGKKKGHHKPHGPHGKKH